MRCSAGQRQGCRFHIFQTLETIRVHLWLIFQTLEVLCVSVASVVKFFQTLEEKSPCFPMLGKSGLNFSNAWKPFAFIRVIRG